MQKRTVKRRSVIFLFTILGIIFDVFDMCEGFFFAALGEHCQPTFQEVGGGGMHLFARVATLKIGQWMGVGVVFALIDFACRYAVAEHLFDVSQGHFDGLIHFCGGVDVVPILKMVAVAALVVHPRMRAAKEFAFALVGASVALIVARAGDELGGRIFGKVVKKPLPANACAETMTYNAMAMSRDGAKMQKRMRHGSLPPSFLFAYIIPHFWEKSIQKGQI